MDKSLGLVSDMMGQPFFPTDEELGLVVDVQDKLNDLQANHDLSIPVREALAGYAKDQDFLLIFIRGRKLQLVKTVESIKMYAEIRYSKYPELFPEHVSAGVRYTVENRILDLLRHRDHAGKAIAVISFEKWDPQKASLDDMLIAARYIFDFAMRAPETLTTGFAVIVNFAGVRLQHLRWFTLPAILKVLNTFWTAYPYPMRGCYVINAPYLVRPIYAMARPFLPAKFIERVLITSGVKELQHHVSPAILPESLGGTLSDDSALSLDFFNLPN